MAYLVTCARCQGDHDERIDWKPLTHPVDDFTHWAPCPANGEPILCKFILEG